MARMQNLFAEKRLSGIEVGSKQWFDTQREIILSRPLLKHYYDAWYNAMLADEATVPKDQTGIIIEIGAGGSYIKQLRADIITSDVIPGVADMVIDATKIPFADNSVRAIFLTHTFHHIPDVEKFLAEAQRVLVPGGVVSMIDASSTPFAKFFFKHFHPEPHEPKAKTWQFDWSHNMHDSNQALTWIVFKRDRLIFEHKFPHLHIEKTKYLPWLGYMASGGVTRKSMVPKFMVPVVKGVDWISAPLKPAGTLMWQITLRKV